MALNELDCFVAKRLAMASFYIQNMFRIKLQ